MSLNGIWLAGYTSSKRLNSSQTQEVCPFSRSTQSKKKKKPSVETIVCLSVARYQRLHSVKDFHEIR
jgi:hypothetical protein